MCLSLRKTFFLTWKKFTPLVRFYQTIILLQHAHLYINSETSKYRKIESFIYSVIFCAWSVIRKKVFLTKEILNGIVSISSWFHGLCKYFIINEKKLGLRFYTKEKWKRTPIRRIGCRTHCFSVLGCLSLSRWCFNFKFLVFVCHSNPIFFFLLL